MAADLLDTNAEQELRSIQREYINFLDDDTVDPSYPYSQRVKDMVSSNQYRLIVSINDLRKKHPKRVMGLLKDSFREIGCFQVALKSAVDNVDVEYGKQIEEFFVGFEGSFGQRHVNPRTLRSSFLNNMVCCEGIVTKCSLIRPKVVRSVHYCPNTKKTVERRYTDLTSSDAFPSSSVYPTEDESHNPLETEYGLSVYKDHQTFSIQELPENAPAGQLPRSVDVVADNDLADRCKPGDRVRVIGVYRCLPSKKSGVTQGTFRTILISNNIQLLSKDAIPMYSELDIARIKQFLKKKKDILNILTRSLAPSIYGHEEVKRAILCMMVGGTEKILPNGTRLRGDINILMIGDPSVAKSQLLRYVCQTAHRAIATTGRGSSGVGLTAAVTTDQETGERRLEAGAMVLGDRGVVCIDEFDKMSDIDRTAIHEVMEQGRVSISKAGIHAKLNARCAVLAAANPVYGRYDDGKTPMENIAMQDALLSRFDLLFVMLDEHNTERDHSVAEHVIKLHKFRPAGEPDGTVFGLGGAMQTLTTHDLEKEEENEDNFELYETDTQWLPHKEKEKILTATFFAKYVEFAKHLQPILTDEACKFICEKYADLRAFDEKHSDKEKTMPVTARLLETLIRLSTAFAKTRFSKKVTTEDAERAFDLVNFACFKEKPPERKETEDGGKTAATKRRRKNDDDDERSEGDDPENGENEEGRPPKKKEHKQKSDDPYTFDSDMDDDSDDIIPYAEQRAKKDGQETSTVAAIDIQRYELFKKYIRQIFDSERTEQLPISTVTDQLQKLVGARPFIKSELDAAFERMSDENRAMVSQGVMYLI